MRIINHWKNLHSISEAKNGTTNNCHIGNIFYGCPEFQNYNKNLETWDKEDVKNIITCLIQKLQGVKVQGRVWFGIKIPKNIFLSINTRYILIRLLNIKKYKSNNFA